MCFELLGLQHPQLWFTRSPVGRMSRLSSRSSLALDSAKSEVKSRALVLYGQPDSSRGRGSGGGAGAGGSEIVSRALQSGEDGDGDESNQTGGGDGGEMRLSLEEIKQNEDGTGIPLRTLNRWSDCSCLGVHRSGA
jgi:hypothetical protein